MIRKVAISLKHDAPVTDKRQSGFLSFTFSVNVSYLIY